MCEDPHPSSPGPKKPKKLSEEMDVDSHIREGNALLLVGRVHEAIEEYRAALDKDPENAEVHYNLGLIYRKTMQLDDAIREYREAIRVDPGNMKYHNNLAAALVVKGQKAEAVKEYEEALRIEPKNATLHFNRGFALDEMGELQEAKKEYEEALRIDPGFDHAMFYLGMLKKKLK